MLEYNEIILTKIELLIILLYLFLSYRYEQQNHTCCHNSLLKCHIKAARRMGFPSAYNAISMMKFYLASMQCKCLNKFQYGTLLTNQYKPIFISSNVPCSIYSTYSCYLPPKKIWQFGLNIFY